MEKVRKRLVLVYLCLVLVVAVILSFSSFQHSTALYRAEVRSRLLDGAVLIGEALAKEPHGDEPGAMDQLAVRYAKLMAKNNAAGIGAESNRVTFIREDGVVLGDSQTDSRKMENHSDRKEVQDALKNGTGSAERASATLGVPFLYHAEYFPERHLVIRLAMPLHALQSIKLGILRTAAAGVAGSVLLTVVLAYVLSRYVTSPVIRLSRQLSAMSETEYSKRLKTPDEAELGTLTQNVNVMAERLERSIRDLRDRNAKVDTIINSLQNGLVAVDQDLRLIMANPVVFGMFGMKEQTGAIGLPLVEVFRNRALLDMLETTVSGNTAQKREIITYDSGKRILEVNVCPIKPMEGSQRNTGALAHVVDVTGVRKLEDMRSEFVSNVTHELKTPLTSIRGFVETLRSGALQDEAVASRFLDIIDIEADRLSMLINDILSLSEIEGTKQELSISAFPLAPLTAEVVAILSVAASERDVHVEVDIPAELEMTANRNRIKQLLINLLDNAIKYNREGGSVHIGAEPDPEGKTVIRVGDTGIGIPEPYTERIFERFYRVDKGRARAQGGTGLGLSIVKHIAQLYGGTVTVESEPGKGSTFTVTI